MESVNEALRGEIKRLEGELQGREEQVKKLTAMIRERDSRKKNAEKMLDQVEKRNKELIEDHVKKELEIEELKRKCAEHLADLQRFKEDLQHQDDLRKKREDQVQALLSQLKRKETENIRLAKELKRRDEETKELNASIQSLAAKVEKETKLKMQRELEQVRGLAAAKEGEMRVVKEMIKSYHHQLKQKEVEVVRFRKKAEVRKPGGRLPPLESQSLIDNLPSKTSLKSKLSSKDFTKKQRSPKLATELDDDSALEQVMAQSQQALYPPTVKSPKRELVLTDNKTTERGHNEEIKAAMFDEELMAEPKPEEAKRDGKGDVSDEDWPRTEIPKETDYTRDEAGIRLSGEEGYPDMSGYPQRQQTPPQGRDSAGTPDYDPTSGKNAELRYSPHDSNEGGDVDPPLQDEDDQQYDDPQSQDSQHQDPQYQDPQHQDPQYQDPQHQDPQYQDPQYEDSQYQDSQYQDPQHQDLQYQDPQPQDLQYPDPQSDHPHHPQGELPSALSGGEVPPPALTGDQIPDGEVDPSELPEASP